MNIGKLKILLEEIKFLLKSFDAGIANGLNEKRILKRFSTLMNVQVECIARGL